MTVGEANQVSRAMRRLVWSRYGLRRGNCTLRGVRSLLKYCLLGRSKFRSRSINMLRDYGTVARPTSTTCSKCGLLPTSSTRPSNLSLPTPPHFARRPGNRHRNVYEYPGHLLADVWGTLGSPLKVRRCSLRSTPMVKQCRSPMHVWVQGSSESRLLGTE